jgi:hypothetical protein
MGKLGDEEMCLARLRTGGEQMMGQEGVERRLPRGMESSLVHKGSPVCAKSTDQGEGRRLEKPTAYHSRFTAFPWREQYTESPPGRTWMTLPNRFAAVENRGYWTRRRM